MLLFALKRALWTVPVLLVCVTLLFALVHAIGGSPLRHGPPLGLSHEAWVKYGDPKPGAITANEKRRLGIDAPWYDQYWRYLRSVARLDFGPTTTFPNRTVNEILREQGPITAELVGLALVWVVVLGVGLGVGAAVWRGTLFDRAATATTAVLMGVPIFLTATLAIWLLSVKLGLVPASGWNGWLSWLLPSFVLALLPLAQIARVLRFEMIEVGAREFVLAARAKGLRRPRLLAAHVLRPASVPVLSMAGPLVGQLVLGLFLVEWIFAIPGIGRYFIAAAQTRDYPLTLGLTVVLTTCVVAVNALSDIALAAIDPRVREATSGRSA
jgi:ABC-type dipeptide/oligopeptide/nickel transport system permease component